MRWTWAVALLLLGGCDVIRFDDFVKQHAIITRTEPEPPGDTCAHGGHAVLVGEDKNDDGQLSEDEVTATEYVCATTFPGVLVRTRSVAPGKTCPAGGHVTQAGVDVNGNGILEEGEITREATGCLEPAPVLSAVVLLGVREESECGSRAVYAVESGADLNANGALDDDEVRASSRFCESTARILMRQVEESPGVNCLSGGTAVISGEDSNQDNVLQEGEVFGTAYVCQPAATYDGTYELRTESDLAALQNISRIRGGLVIASPGIPEVVLPGLESVEGPLLIAGNPMMLFVSLPALRYVRDDVTVSDNARLTDVVLGPLASPPRQPLLVGGSLKIERNASLTHLNRMSSVMPRASLTLIQNRFLQEVSDFPFVDSLSGDVRIENNSQLSRLPLSQLTHVGGSLEVLDNRALESLTGLQKLKTVGHTLLITGNTVLSTMLGLEQLVSVGTQFEVSDNPALHTFALPRLESTGELVVEGNLGLKTVGPLPLLKDTGFMFALSSNPELESLTGLGRLRSLQGGLHIRSNAKLKDLSAFAALESVDHLNVEENRVLASLNGLHHVRAMDALTLRDNPLLVELKLDSLEVVRGSFSVHSNPKLPNCHAVALAEAVHTGPLDERFVGSNDDTSPLCPPP
ncbi:DUF7151 family protein [Myxococcus qinghaiensis]|uniref:DUF7151 family protein n=1 Tax=Myxococcus qinghaiensis TaxID=2906758 RepID=UPI0020A7F1C3|nr:hypothetical protein [Myxococcus qinghaiensis]MCP3165399.1 hypothetical protein [Myxococcus qinghaiensis]